MTCVTDPRSVASSLHVGELLGDLAVTQPEHVDAAHMAVTPVVAPQLHVPIPGRERVLGLEVRTRVVEDRLPRRPYGVLPLVPFTVGRGPGALERAVVRAQREGGVEVVRAPRRVEATEEVADLGVGHGPSPTSMSRNRGA